jgi:hypothetical protein
MFSASFAGLSASQYCHSTRQGWFSEKPAQWILQQLRKREGIEARLLDLRDFPMPFFDQAASPGRPGRALTRMKLSTAGPPK